MIVVDAHQDIAYNALALGRDYTRSAWEQRRREGRSQSGLVANGLPDALLGRIGVIFATLFAEPAHSPMSLPTSSASPGYETPQQAHDQALQQWDYYQRLFDETEGRVVPVRTEAELDAVLDTWAEGTDLRDHRIGLALLMEGADPILEPKQLEEWVERGVRIVGPAWSATRYAGGTGSPGPLTDLGRELLEAMAGYHLILDLSHTTEEGYFEALDRYAGPVIASHSNPTAFWDHHRNLTDEQIRRLAERDGVIGVNLYNRFLSETWRAGDPQSDVPFEILIAALDHICQVTGSAAHAGIGSDIDGGFGAESIPAGIDTVTDFLKIGDGLAARGYDAETVENILGGNFLRVLRRALS